MWEILWKVNIKENFNKFKKIILTIIIIFFSLSGCVSTGSENYIVISAASSLQESLEELVRLYKKETPQINFRLNFGGSHILKQQIIEGFKVDLFLSAHVDYFEQLVELGFVEQGQVFAQNEVVLITNNNYIQRVEDLTNENLRLIFAHKYVPIGSYTQDILNKINKNQPGFKESVLSNVISKEENVRQVLLKISLGEGDAGFVYKTDALIADNSIRFIELPEEYKLVTELYISLLKRGERNIDAYNFYNFVLGEIGQEVLSRYGFK